MLQAEDEYEFLGASSEPLNIISNDKAQIRGYKGGRNRLFGEPLGQVKGKPESGYHMDWACQLEAEPTVFSKHVSECLGLRSNKWSDMINPG